jgi:DNA-binding NtrC family response regulator
MSNAMTTENNHKQSILIVDDDLNILEILEARLTSKGYHIFRCERGEEALQVLKSNGVDLMISDMKMPGMSGLELLEKARQIKPDLPIIFITAYGTIPDAVKAVKAGAADYLGKPFDGKELLQKVRKHLKWTTEPVNGEDMSPVIHDSLRAQSPVMKKLYEIVEKVARSNVNVLILGESGVGKERIARMVHELSSREKKPFVVVDCGSTPAGLLESELFGHVRGAFTHAVSDKKGLIETADSGTLFLDEIGNISPEMQIRLLRFIEDRKIRRIGELKEKPVDCRILAATNADLLEDIKAGRFREDLYYRLRVVTLQVPSLAERKEDIPLLAEHFLDVFCKQHNLPKVKLPEETLNWLLNYPWPGNIRELKNAIEAGIVLCKDGVLCPKDMHLGGLPEMPEEDQQTTSSAPFTLEENERLAIVRALKKTGGIQKDAAELLGISRRAIHYKIKKYNIDSAALRSRA